MESEQNWETVVRKLLLVFFALVSILFLTFVAGLEAMSGIGEVFDERYIYGTYQIVSFCICLVGTFALARYIYGTPLIELFGGMVTGAIVMLAFVLRPFIYEALEARFQFENPITNSGLAGLASVIYIVPLLIFWVLARSSSKLRRVSDSSSHGAA